jgi:hypothetical protein
MHPCNRGETPTRSVHENAAKTTTATITRPQFCERAELFIGLEACDNGGVCASYFPGELFLRCNAKAMRRRIALQSTACEIRESDWLFCQNLVNAYTSLRDFHHHSPFLVPGATLVWKATP